MKLGSLLSVNQLSLEKINYIFSMADDLLPLANRTCKSTILDGALLANLFFEASTRTRMSFFSAFSMLGGKISETTGFDSSALAKGESLADMARVINSYADIVVMRHPENKSTFSYAKESIIPVINAGDGTNEHPTQALLDLYTIQKELKRKSLDKLKICFMGDLLYGRTVHSLSKLLLLYKDVEFYFISSEDLSLPNDLLELLNSNNRVHIKKKIDEKIDVDIIYQTRIQKERFANEKDALKYQGQVALDQKIFNTYFLQKPFILHPLPRDSMQKIQEINTNLDNHKKLSIFRQVKNGLLIRMSLFCICLDVQNKIKDSFKPIKF